MSSKTDEVRAALRKIVDQEGAGCLRDVSRFRSLWMDYAPQNSKEAKLILSAVQEGVGSILVSAIDKDETGQRQCIKRCEQKLAEAYIVADGARFAIREIGSALRLDVDRLVPLPDTGELQAGVKSGQSQGYAPDPNRQEIYPGKKGKSRKEEVRAEEFPSGSAVKETPAKRKRKFPWLLLLLLLIFVGGVAAIFLSGGDDVVPVPPVDVQDEEPVVPAVLPPVEEPEEEPDKESETTAPAVLPTDDGPKEEPPAEPESKQYEIDTIASNIGAVESMVMDNENNLYYIAGKSVYSTKAPDSSIDFSTDNTESGYLAYDPYNDIVYLLITVGKENPTILDISDFGNYEPGVELEPVLDEANCPALAAIGMFYQNNIIYPLQLGVLKNGALLAPCLTRGNYETYMINIDEKTVTPTTTIYGTDRGVIIDDMIIRLYQGSTEAEVISFDGTTTKMEFEYPIPNTTMYVRNGAIYFYDNLNGVCRFNLDGTVSVEIPLESIEVKDYQSLNNTDVWGIAVGTDGRFAFYDQTLKCIRLIRPTDAAAE